MAQCPEMAIPIEMVLPHPLTEMDHHHPPTETDHQGPTEMAHPTTMVHTERICLQTEHIQGMAPSPGMVLFLAVMAKVIPDKWTLVSKTLDTMDRLLPTACNKSTEDPRKTQGIWLTIVTVLTTGDHAILTLEAMGMDLLGGT
jgi:hypothetical protein